MPRVRPPGGGASNSLNFTITQPNQNPVPSIDERTGGRNRYQVLSFGDR